VLVFLLFPHWYCYACHVSVVAFPTLVLLILSHRWCYSLGANWQPKHITFHLSEATNTTKQTLAKIWAKLLDIYGLKRIIVSYVKDEGSNLNIITTTLKFSQNNL
jgi:hypothetical protein